MTAAAPDLDANRHRVLEGVLLRLARRPDARAFVLRGGLLMRHWFRPVPRPADDVDLVATFSFDVEETGRRFVPVLAEQVADGVSYDPGRTRVSGIRLDSDAPAVRVFATGTAGGDEFDFNVDITFGPVPHPPAALTELPTASGTPARLWACPPEAVAAQKLQALLHRDALAWRPKDLHDLRLLLVRVPMDPGDLRAAVAAYLAHLGRAPDDVRALFAPGAWWDMKLSAARWSDFVKQLPGTDAPGSLAAVVAEVASRLAPILLC